MLDVDGLGLAPLLLRRRRHGVEDCCRGREYRWLMCVELVLDVLCLELLWHAVEAGCHGCAGAGSVHRPLILRLLCERVRMEVVCEWVVVVLHQEWII